MKTYTVELSSPIATSFRCTKAANSLDIDVAKKAIHRFSVTADVETPFSVGLIVGASGSGKTTLAKMIYGDACFATQLDMASPVIDQFASQYSYDECASMLTGVGLTSVPCWVRPAYTLSNGQRARAECALQMARDASAPTIIDEWTSVVDRTVAKVMSFCVQKHARKTGKSIVLLSCHYDVAEWLNPDWIIDCNTQAFIDRRRLHRDFVRTEQLEFQVRRITPESWKYFSKYHYLSDALPGGLVKYFGLFHDDVQIGFQAFANYVPHRSGKIQMHSNRTVIHPDYAGLGLGIHLINYTSYVMAQQGFDVRAKFSSTPVYKAMSKQRAWKLIATQRDTPKPSVTMGRQSGFRHYVKTYSFKFVPELYDQTSHVVIAANADTQTNCPAS